MKNYLPRAVIAMICFLFTSFHAFSQGCVAIRSSGGTFHMEHPDSNARAGWLLNVNNRYYKSFRHFVGSQEQTQRIAQGTQVINHAYTMDISLTRIIDDRWSVALDLPVLSNSRSSLYEHGGKERHSTNSFGLGDMRVAAYAWLFKPSPHGRGNIQLGLGIKLPSGDDNYQDYFYNIGPNGSKILGPVDQSIQLGDGGTGITAELNAWYRISHLLGFYANGYYLANPRDVNGISTARGIAPSPAAVQYGSDVMSVPDQYMARAGLNLNLGKFMISGGLRDECLPVYDLIGKSDGFRRPGYILSAEPGIAYSTHSVSLYVFAPWAIVRNRTQSVPDKNQTAITGIYHQGDAAFADYALNIGCSIKF